ncbi:hypothetical protein VNO78_05709 [Psophocarpus tetragonolobus]|uniref:Uncharacterized protein n=1 Tax=Psophocarpus tetragonolobus TaxID=3891 RepID=A0AAN9XR39_PSOTE
MANEQKANNFGNYAPNVTKSTPLELCALHGLQYSHKLHYAQDIKQRISHGLHKEIDPTCIKNASLMKLQKPSSRLIFQAKTHEGHYSKHALIMMSYNGMVVKLMGNKHPFTYANGTSIIPTSSKQVSHILDEENTSGDVSLMEEMKGTLQDKKVTSSI